LSRYPDIRHGSPAGFGPFLGKSGKSGEAGRGPLGFLALLAAFLARFFLQAVGIY
jgi:hypothetical protein